jgi:hypothetical protein
VKKVLFPILALVLALGLGLMPAMPATATTGVIWTIGTFDDSRAEFNHTDFDGVDEATYDVATDTASDFPAFLYINGYSGSWEEEGVHKVTINFSLTTGYRDVTLKYRKAGGETDEVSLDGGTPQTVYGPGENIFSTYELSLGNLSSGTHHIVIECVDKGTGEGAHTYDALELSGLAGTNLIAGGGNPKSAMDAGDVLIWNDGDNLYVKYMTSGDWCLTETHLHVATSLDAIPQKNGNPPPGQFDYPMEHDCVTQYTYTIDLGDWEPCETDLYIAAHAEVQKLSDVMTASLASGDDTDSVLVIAENTTDPGYPLGYPGPYSDTPTSSVVIQGTEAAYSGWPTITGAQWISDSTVDPGIVNSWRLFARNFSLPSNATNISGTLHIDSDNAEKAKINGSPADGLVYGDVYGGFTDDGEWNWVQHWPVGSYLQPGPNTLEVMVRNYYWEPTPGMWNYTGLVYKMDYEYQLLTTETAWGDGLDFDGKNWATYFMYHVQ